MSFFDEADEPPRTETRSTSRPSSRRGSGGSDGSGRGPRRRPPSHPPQQSIRTRRSIAVVAFVIVIIIIAVAVSSCEGSANRSALQNYGDNVNSIITSSNGTSHKLFNALSSAGGASSSVTSQKVNEALAQAENELSSAQRQSVPSAAEAANSHLVTALQLRRDGLANIAAEIQPALGSQHQEPIRQITQDMAAFLASDVIYKDYTVKELVSALHGAGIAVGGQNGTPINGGQFLPSVQWLQTGYVGAQLGSGSSSGASSTSGPVTGLHGDALTSVTYNGTALVNGATVTANPPPTFGLNVTDQGNFTETNVLCKVQVLGTSIVGTKVIPSIGRNQSLTCDVTLRSSPPAGNYNIKASVAKVPGEHNLSNNSLGISVAFK